MVHLLWRCLRDIVVLTVQASEVTACAGKRKTLGAWMEMIERLLFNGVDGQRTGLSIDLAKENTTIIATTATASCLTFSNMTMMRTEQAFQLSILQLPIIPTLVIIHFSLKTRSLHRHIVRHPSSHPNQVQPCLASNVLQTLPSSNLPHRQLVAGKFHYDNPCGYRYHADATQTHRDFGCDAWG